VTKISIPPETEEIDGDVDIATGRVNMTLNSLEKKYPSKDTDTKDSNVDANAVSKSHCTVEAFNKIPGETMSSTLHNTFPDDDTKSSPRIRKDTIPSRSSGTLTTCNDNIRNRECEIGYDTDFR
jgi:hypothetical protein